MNVTGQRELTSTEYWNDEWRRLAPTSAYGSLQWVERNYVYRSLDTLLRSVLPVTPDRTFIEMGSGPARWMIYFHRRFGYRVFGCDYSEVSCELARRNLAAAGIAGEITQADFMTIGGRYDVVFSGGVVEHFDRPLEVLEAFNRVLAPGGILITDVPNLGGINGLYQRLLKPETFETHRLVTLGDLRHWHAALGLHELLATPYGSISLSRLPAGGFRRFPWLERALWRPLHLVASRGLNRACLLLHRARVRLDHPLISPHLLVVSRKPA